MEAGSVKHLVLVLARDFQIVSLPQCALIRGLLEVNLYFFAYLRDLDPTLLFDKCDWLLWVKLLELHDFFQVLHLAVHSEGTVEGKVEERVSWRLSDFQAS